MISGAFCNIAGDTVLRHVAPLRLLPDMSDGHAQAQEALISPLKLLIKLNIYG